MFPLSKCEPIVDTIINMWIPAVEFSLFVTVNYELQTSLEVHLCCDICLPIDPSSIQVQTYECGIENSRV